MHDLTDDGMLTPEARFDSAMAAMRELPAVDNDAAARVAARAVLANAPEARASAWSLRVAAAVAIVALGAAGIAATRAREPGGVAVIPESVAGAPAVGATLVTPVMATTARPIVFELDAPDARSVQVLGDFNQWSRTSATMARGSDGHWRLTTLLPPGRYVYAFLVDGQRFERDVLRDAVEDPDFGVTGSELVVGEAP